MARWWQLKCRRGDHDWFPGRRGPSEFLPLQDICLRCRQTRTVLPWGQCLSGHPIKDHYTDDGELRPVANCPGPS